MNNADKFKLKRQLKQKADKERAKQYKELSDSLKQLTGLIKGFEPVIVQQLDVDGLQVAINGLETKLTTTYDNLRPTQELKDIQQAIKDIHVPEPKPGVEKKDVDRLVKIVQNKKIDMSAVVTELKEVVSAVKKEVTFSQEAKNYIPFRRVYWNGNKFEFDDSGWRGGTGGSSSSSGGSSSSVITDIQDGAGDSIMDAANDAMRVNVVAGSTSGTEYDDGDADATPTGAVAMGTDGSNVFAIATDTDGHQQVDVLSSALPSGAATASNQSTLIGHVDGIETLLGTIDSDTSTLAGTDFMLGTDFSDVFGTTSVVNIATLADDISNSTDVVNTRGFNMMFDGTAWDRVRGDSTNGMLVNLGSNNDVTVTGTVDLGATDNAVLDSIVSELQDIETDVEATNTALGGTLTVDATGQGDVPVTLDSEQVSISDVPQPTPPTAVSNGQKTVSSAGTAEAIAASTPVNGVIIQALSDNVGNVYVGDSSVDSSNGMELQPGQATSVAIDNLSKVYVDADNNDDGVCFIGS